MFFATLKRKSNEIFILREKILKNKPKIKTNSFDMNSLRNLHLNKNLTKLKGFLNISRPRY